VARKTLSDNGVAALKPRAARFAFADPELAGHYVRVTPNGAKSYCAVARDPGGKQVWTTIGAPDPKALPIEESRSRARQIMRRVRDGLPAIEPKGETFGAVAEEWRARHVRKNGLRSAAEIERLIDRYILPAWRDREFVSIRRSDVASLLDHIEDKHGPRQADCCLAIVRGIMNWFASRRDDYTPPIARGMRRQSPTAQARSRVLTDDELRAVWEAAGACGAFGGLVQTSLLTAQRRDKVATMRWIDVENGVWTIPAAPREKSAAGTLALPEMARRIIDTQATFADNPFVFASGRCKGPLAGFSKLKDRLDRLSGISGWTLHDLRRSARSLMSRAGVSSEHAERVMGHAIGGVEGVYDRHGYREEKAAALAKLAALVDTIVGANVVPLRRKRSGGSRS
jgi:integrase